MDTGDDIYIVTDGTLRTLPSVELREGLFGAKLEDALQSLLQQYPELIPGRQIAPDDEEPPRFLLLRREMPLSGWSLDLLMVDQRGVLTLVEAKLMQNPESRRDVIGQIIEYAANAFELWASGAARQYAAEYWNRIGRGGNWMMYCARRSGPTSILIRFGRRWRQIYVKGESG